jgi:hypothetical protein
MKPARGISVLLFAAIAAMSARADHEDGYFAPRGSFTVELSLESSPHLRLPLNRNAVTSLVVSGDYAIGGTTASDGRSPFLFAVSLSRKKLERILDLESIVPGQRAVVSGFDRGRDGVLFAGTMPQTGTGTGTDAGGHLLGIALGDSGLTANDLGIPVPGEGIFALAADAARDVVYGLSHPSGKFWSLEIASRRTKVWDDTVADERMRFTYRQFALQPQDYLSRRLIVDASGRVYGSRPVNKIFRFDPATQRIEIMPGELPGHSDRRVLGRADTWAIGPDGRIYGGNAGEGQLFRLDPATGVVVNLGKPTPLPRMKGIAFGRDGKLYGIAGGTPGYSRVFQYEPGGGFTDLGIARFEMVGDEMPRGLFWRGFQLVSLAASENGRYIVMGDDEALSQLMVFEVQ